MAGGVESESIVVVQADLVWSGTLRPPEDRAADKYAAGSSLTMDVPEQPRVYVVREGDEVEVNAV